MSFYFLLNTRHTSISYFVSCFTLSTYILSLAFKLKNFSISCVHFVFSKSFPKPVGLNWITKTQVHNQKRPYQFTLFNLLETSSTDSHRLLHSIFSFSLRISSKTVMVGRTFSFPACKAGSPFPAKRKISIADTLASRHGFDNCHFVAALHVGPVRTICLVLPRKQDTLFPSSQLSSFKTHCRRIVALSMNGLLPSYPPLNCLYHSIY